MQRRVDRTLLTGAAGFGMLAVAMGVLPGIPSANQQRMSVGLTAKRSGDEEVRVAPVPRVSPAPADASFEKYRRLLEFNPFAPRLPKKAPVATPSTTGPDTAPVLPPAGKPPETRQPETPPAAPAPTKPPEMPDPLKDWVYSGTVAIGDEVYAVLENKASKQGRYLKAGEVLEGATLESVGQAELALSLNGVPRTLAKSSAFNATPLNASTGGSGGPPNPGGAPGQPGAPAGPTPVAAPPSGAPPAGSVSRRPTPVTITAPPGAVISAPAPAVAK